VGTALAGKAGEGSGFRLENIANSPEGHSSAEACQDGVEPHLGHEAPGSEVIEDYQN
jgi:hypothetical protein